MGWNSWDCFATTVTEAQTKAHADYMAEKLARYGWEYVVVDIQWYEPNAKSFDYRHNAKLVTRRVGAFAACRKSLSIGRRRRGLQSRWAITSTAKNSNSACTCCAAFRARPSSKTLPSKDTSYHAADIANKKDICPWNPDMYGVDMSKPGAQEYYNSVFDLFAQWGVDFVKVDDISRPYNQHRAEIEAVRKAIDQTGRPMVLSLSPGETALDAAEHVRKTRQYVADQRRLLGQVAAGSRPVRAAEQVEQIYRSRPLAGCRHAAAGHRGPGPEDKSDQGRTIHADDLVVHRPFAADLRRRHGKDGRFHALADNQRGSDRGRSTKQRQSSAFPSRWTYRLGGRRAELDR